MSTPHPPSADEPVAGGVPQASAAPEGAADAWDGSAGQAPSTPPPPIPPYAAPAPPPYGTPAASAPYGGQPPYGAPGGHGAYPAPPAYPGSSATPYPVAPPTAPYGAPAYGYPQVKTNVLAVISLISSLVGVLFSWTFVLGLGVVAGVITGHIALRQIARTGENGRGMALAGVIVGWVGIGLSVLAIIGIVLFWGALGLGAATYGV